MKILYNVTINIDHDIEKEWKEWMIHTHIPEVMATDLFESYQMQKIISGEHVNGVTYAIQYLAPSPDHYDKYIAEYAPAIREKTEAKYKDKYGAFRTIMQVVSYGKREH